jgi:3-phosphoshikimate 1-carboxyvinyltransferase
MIARITPHRFSGTIRIPASKSHTIRQLLIASFASGVSEIHYPLDSFDAGSCAAACRILGADVKEIYGADPLCPNPANTGGEKLLRYVICGNGGRPPDSAACGGRIDVGNSGTTLYLALALAGLGSTPFEFTGDEQIQKRSAAPLLRALQGLGVRAESLRGSGCAPIVIQGPWKGGRISMECPTSQYLSALLIAAPLAPAGTVTEIEVPLLNEKPYIEMTLSYLKSQGLPFDAAPDFSHFVIPGGSCWKPFSHSVPGDFSSAAFPACAAAISGSAVTILGLDPCDTQGDKFFFELLTQMGCAVEWRREKESGAEAGGEWAVTISRSGPLRGGMFDLNATPDLLPATAVCAAFAQGDTALVNVAHARIKETDRIAVMAAELSRLGVKCSARPDGMIIHGGALDALSGGSVDGHGDHRVVMALAAAALGAAAPVWISSAESAAVTYPGFLELLGAEFI